MAAAREFQFNIAEDIEAAFNFEMLEDNRSKAAELYSLLTGVPPQSVQHVITAILPDIDRAKLYQAWYVAATAADPDHTHPGLLVVPMAEFARLFGDNANSEAERALYSAGKPIYFTGCFCVNGKQLGAVVHGGMHVIQPCTRPPAPM